MWRFMVAALAAALLVPGPAVAADHFVGVSRPGASDAGPCTSIDAPCASIQAAVDKSAAQGGGLVRVLANPDGRTTDTYAEAVALGGSAPVTLIGPGRGRANGAIIAPSAGRPLTLGAGDTARSLRLVAPSGGTAVAAAATSTVDDVLAEASGGTAYVGAGRVEDSRLVGRTGARLVGAELVRTEVVSTHNGVVARLGTSRLLQVVVRPRATIDVPPAGDALRVGGDTGAARAELRHVTLTGFPARVRIDGRAAQAGMQAVNSTFAGDGGTDLVLHGQASRAKLRTVNQAPARTSLMDGARPGNMSIVDPVDLDPGLTPDAKLSPSSPLIDRGTRAGLFEGDPDNVTDVGGDPRVQGVAPDVGADETTPARPDGLRWISVGTFFDPMWVASPPGDIDRVFVVERRGTVWVVERGVVHAEPAIDISARITQNGSGALSSIAFAPDFATSGRVYGFYTRREDPATPDLEMGDIVISEWTMDAANPNRIDPGSERRLMLIENTRKQSHHGGTLIFGPDGYLWITTGDGDTQPIPSQDLSQIKGKILRIDPRPAGGAPYGIPPDNPYVGVAGALPEVWARGLRNPFRMGFDSFSGDLWLGDVGNKRFEEINLLTAADGRGPRANFGWRVTEGDVLFQSGVPVTPANQPPDYVAPVILRRHDEGDFSVTAGTVVRDPTIEALQGRFLYADFFLGVTRAAVAAQGGVSEDGEVEGLPAVPGVTSYSMDGCGRIYATQLFSGEVVRLATTGQCVPPLEACTIVGTEGNEHLTGTPGRDVICGLGGRDKLFGFGGDDLLVGGDGDDTLKGGAGGDVLQGGAGSDLADYEGANQPVTVTIGAGADDGAGEADDVEIDVERVRGGNAADRLTAGSRGARLIGGDGADVLRGSGQKDKLEGQAGDDDLDGGAGHDEMLGGDGDDRLSARDDLRDRLVCGGGLDLSEADPIDVVDPSCE